jgi:hypothetical protein
VALPRFSPGDHLVADTAITQFEEPGLYLYPAWGQPRLYDVQGSTGRLEFRNPGTGQLLWTQSSSLDSAFAGRVVDPIGKPATVAGLAGLTVPRQPVTG